jgi:hypothetical protein
MQRFFDIAMMFKVLDKEASKSKSLIQEEKKQEEPAEVGQKKDPSSEVTQKTNIYAVVDEAVATKPWKKLLEEEKSGLANMVKMGPHAFTNKLKVLVDLANELKLSEGAQIVDFLTLPMINGNREIMAAIMLQNVMQPKNPQRREAIASKSYNELKNAAEAEAYFSEMISQNLKIELAGRESSIRAHYVQAASGQSATYFLDAPDIHFAAAVLLQEGFLIGNGGRNQIIY